MRKAMREWWLYARQLPTMVEAGVGFEVTCLGRKDTVWLRLRVWFAEVQTFAEYVLCEIRGHEPVDEGYGGPESGRIEIVCSRCGAGLHRVVLY